MKRVSIVLLAAVCFNELALGQKVTCQYERGMDFSKFHAYKWAPAGQNGRISQITAHNIVNLVNTQLAQKGLVLVREGQDADLYVAYQASATQHQQLNWFNSDGPWLGSMGSAITSTTGTGTLVVEFYNAGRKQLVWRGIATKSMNPTGNLNKNYENLQRSVEKLLRGFPPSAKNR